MSSHRPLSIVAGVSGIYDLIIGAGLLFAADRFAGLFGIPVPEPRLFVSVCGVLLICVGMGYLQPLRDPMRHRAYLWIFGPILKGAGALIFVAEHVRASGPQPYLLFASTDGTLAVVTLAFLVLSSYDRRVNRK